MGWSESDIPDQTGRVAVVTGSNSGIGYETARALAERGASVVLACRSPQRGEEALAKLRAHDPGLNVRLILLDLADLASVRAFAEELGTAFDRLDLLINNAGVMMPSYSKTAQGFELQIGVNHLGHFALTARLMPLLRATAGARVVNVSSIAHLHGKLDFDDLHYEGKRRYIKYLAYAQSKLANMLFTLELQRRLEAAGADLQALASHPGFTTTNLQRHVASFRIGTPLVAMDPPQGALPSLRAATDPAAKGGEYYGPNGFLEIRGAPERAKIAKRARDEGVAAMLWEVSAGLTDERIELS